MSVINYNLIMKNYFYLFFVKTKFRYIFLSLALFFALSNCGAKKEIVKEKPFKPQRLLWSSSTDRPEWLVIEPEKEGDKIFFVGLSEYCATEKNAREEAMRSATGAVVSYINVSVKNIYRELSVKYGKSSEISDPTIESKNLQEFVKNSVVSRVKAYKWYIEQWLNADNESYWKVYSLVSVPEDAIKQAVTSGVADYEKNLKLEYEKEQVNIEKKKKKANFGRMY